MNTHKALNLDSPFRKLRMAKSFTALPVAFLFVSTAFLSAGSAFAEDSNRSISKRHERRDHDRYDRRGQYDERRRYDDHDRYDSRRRHNGHDRYDRHDQYNRNDRRDQYDRNRDRRRYEYNRHARPGYYPTDRYDSHRRRFKIPKVIIHNHRHQYKDYYNSRVYYRDHRHHHDIYRFPVYVEGRLTYRPYAYCEGNYFATGYFGIDGPHFSIRLGF